MTSPRVKRIRPGVFAIALLATLAFVWGMAVDHAGVVIAAMIIDLIAMPFLLRKLPPGTHPQAMERDSHFDR